MKNLLLSLLLLFSITSCELSEHVYVNQDGSDKFEFDASKSMNEMMTEEEKTSEAIKESTFVFKDFLEKNKDSISTLTPEKQEDLKSFESFKINIYKNKREKVFRFKLISDFTHVGELNNIFEK